MLPKPEVTYWVVKYDMLGGRDLTSCALMTVTAVRDQLKWLVESKGATNLRVREYHMRTTVSDVTDAFQIIGQVAGGPGDTVTITTTMEINDV